VSKKKQAFELFSQGKTPHSPEVEELGLTRRLRNRYFREWKRLQEAKIEETPVEVPSAPTETPTQTVPLSTIAMGGKFEYESKLYRKVNVVQGAVIGLALIEQDNQMFLSSHDRVMLDGDTQVVAK